MRHHLSALWQLMRAALGNTYDPPRGHPLSKQHPQTHFTAGETEEQRRHVTNVRSHSQKVGEAGFEPKHTGPTSLCKSPPGHSLRDRAGLPSLRHLSRKVSTQPGSGPRKEVQRRDCSRRLRGVGAVSEWGQHMGSWPVVWGGGDSSVPPPPRRPEASTEVLGPRWVKQR